MKTISSLSSLSRLFVLLVVLSGIGLAPSTADAARIPGKNELAGGFGFQVGFSNWAPGGFKWFNDYSRRITDLVWFNVQFNIALGDTHDDRCWYDGHRWRCYDRHWDGNALELAFGPKLRFELSKIPLVIDAKLGGAFETILFGGEYAGVGFGFRGGAGFHYYFFENFGVGSELMFTFGAAVITDDVGAKFYSTFDMQIIGVHFRW